MKVERVSYRKVDLRQPLPLLFISLTKSKVTKQRERALNDEDAVFPEGWPPDQPPLKIYYRKVDEDNLSGIL